MARASQKPGRSAKHHTVATSASWLTGFHPVREALRAGRRRLDCLWLRAESRRADHAELVDLARAAGVTVERVDAAEIDARAEADGNTQGVALRVGPLPELSLEELLDHVRKTPGPGRRVVALDGVEDPQNVGALARVAESAGALGLILTQRRAPSLSPAVSRASAGAIEWLRVARVANLGRALAALQADGFWIVAAAPASSAAFFDMDDRLFTGNLAVADWQFANFYRREAKNIRESLPDESVVWFTGHWGWQWYARLNGMRQLESSSPEAKPGDYLVIPRGISQQELDPDLLFDPIKVIPGPTMKWTLLSTANGTASFYRAKYLPWRFRDDPLGAIEIFQVVENLSLELPIEPG